MTKQMIVAALAVALSAGGAAANEDDDLYESSYTEDDSELYGYYDAGYDDANENDDWFYDYYELDSDIGTEFWTTDLDTEWGDSDATDLGSDDAGDEGLLDW